MISWSAVWSFVLVVGLLTVAPGLDTALIVRTAAAGAARQAWGVVAGIQCGTLVWGVFASAGIAALLAASALAFDLLRRAGAAYLIWMGLRMLWGSRRRGSEGVRSENAGDPGSCVAGFGVRLLVSSR